MRNRRRASSRLRHAVLATACGTLGGCAFASDFMLPRTAGADLAHFAQSAPKIGSPGPNFSLEDITGKQISLADLTGDIPLVLAFGSYTCPVSRWRHPLLEDLAEEFGNQVRFAMIYTIESHPVGSPCPYTGEPWDTLLNVFTGVRVGQATTAEQRMQTAQLAAADMEISFPVLVDTMDNQVWRAYGSAPTMAFVFDQHANVTMRQVWFEPRAVRTELERLIEVPSTR